VGLTVGLDDPKGFFHPEGVCDSTSLQCDKIDKDEKVAGKSTIFVKIIILDHRMRILYG